MRRGQHVILAPELLATGRQILKLLVVDPRVPLPIDQIRILSPQEDATAVRVFARQAILRFLGRAPGELAARIPALLLQPRHAQILAEFLNLLVVRNVLHGEVGRSRGGAAVGHALDLDKVGFAEVDELGVLCGVFGVHALDEREAVYGALVLVAEGGEATDEPIPVVPKQGSVDRLQRLRRRGVHGNVQLRDRWQVLDGVGKLRVGHQEGADSLGVEQPDEFVNLRVHDRLAHQGQRAVSRVHALLEPFGYDSGDAFHLFDHAAVLAHGLFHDRLRVVHLPPPLAPHRVGVMPPAEHALVRAGQTRRRLHAPVRLYAVEGVLVAAAAPPELRLGPPAQLDPGVRTQNLVSLLGERGSKLRRHHLALFARLVAAHVLHVHAVLGPGARALVVVVARSLLVVRVVKSLLFVRVRVDGGEVLLGGVRLRRGGGCPPVHLLRPAALGPALIRALGVEAHRELVHPVVKLFLHLPRALVAVAPAEHSLASQPGQIGVERPGRRVEPLGAVLPVAAPEHRELDPHQVQHPEALIPRALGRPLAEPARGVGRRRAVGGLVRAEHHERHLLLDQVLGVVVGEVRDLKVDAVPGTEGVGELVRQPARGTRLRSEQDPAPGHGRRHATGIVTVVVGATAPGVARIVVGATAALGAAARVGRFPRWLDRDGGGRLAPVETQLRPKRVP
mmetsp:Transcript_148/g.530  ORF Transcript_148/g.530 Transcript_148/m.530 type:complete len:678 (-) Transcript_148:35-2068(-)